MTGNRLDAWKTLPSAIISGIGREARSLAVPLPRTVGRRRLLDGGDWAAVAGIFVVAFALYGLLAARLAQGVFSEYYNLGFDFDPIRFLHLLTAPVPDRLNAKHPMILIMRPFAWPFLALGLSPRLAAGLVMAAFGGATVAAVYGFLRVAQAVRAEALALSVLYGVTATPIYTAIIPESYGWSGFAIVLVWIVALVRLSEPERLGRSRYVLGVVTTGLTLTNVMQPAIAEGMELLRRASLPAAAARLIAYGVVLGVLCLVLAGLLWIDQVPWILMHPIEAAKILWWQQTGGEKTGAGPIALTFFGYSFVAPVFTIIKLDDGIPMHDFREFRFSAVGMAAIGVWFVFLAVGAVAALRSAAYRPLAIAMVVALIGNVLLHLSFQFRFSLFIYGAHIHFLVFALAAGLAVFRGAGARARAPYVAVVLVLSALTAASNIPPAVWFAAQFDQLDIACQPPCNEGSR